MSNRTTLRLRMVLQASSKEASIFVPSLTPSVGDLVPSTFRGIHACQRATWSRRCSSKPDADKLRRVPTRPVLARFNVRFRSIDPRCRYCSVLQPFLHMPLPGKARSHTATWCQLIMAVFEVEAPGTSLVTELITMPRGRGWRRLSPT
jgi:hypothetical protein